MQTFLNPIGLHLLYDVGLIGFDLFDVFDLPNDDEIVKHGKTLLVIIGGANNDFGSSFLLPSFDLTMTGHFIVHQMLQISK